MGKRLHGCWLWSGSYCVRPMDRAALRWVTKRREFRYGEIIFNSTGTRTAGRNSARCS
jgi:hypothetical protein